VEFIHNDHLYTVRANKEVILCAGWGLFLIESLFRQVPTTAPFFFCSAIKDPQILELSGIGRPDILSKIGVDVKLELPGVGENVQDHPHFATTFEFDPKVSHETLDLMSDPDYVQEITKL